MKYLNCRKQKFNIKISKLNRYALLLNWGFLILFIAAFIYTYYKSEVVLHGERNVLYVKYYIFSIIGILFWTVVLQINHDRRGKILLITTSIVITVYLVEIALHLLPPMKSPRSIALSLGINFDTRTRFEFYSDLKKEGEDVVPAVNPAFLLKRGSIPDDEEPLFSVSGISDKITVGGNENGYFMKFKSDRFGFNNPDSEWDSEEIDWLLIGDSFAYGVAVKQNESIAGQIRSMTKKSAISLGIPGNGPLVELASIKEYAKIIKAKIVLWLYYEGNDLTTNLKREKSVNILQKYLNEGFTQNLVARQNEIDKRLLKYVRTKEDENNLNGNIKNCKLSWILSVLKLSHVRRILHLVDNYAEANVYVDPLFSKILKVANNEVLQMEGKMYFVYLPEYSRYTFGILDHDKYKNRKEVLDAVEKLNIPIIDLHKELFSKQKDPLSFFPFGLPGHYNEKGYNKVTKIIIHEILEFQVDY